MTSLDHDLDAEHRALLAASQRRLAPDATAAARNFAALGRRIAAGEPDPLAGEDVLQDMAEQTLASPVLEDMAGESLAPTRAVVDLRAHRRRTFFVALAAAAALVAALRLGEGLSTTLRGGAVAGEHNVALDQAGPQATGGDAVPRAPEPPRSREAAAPVEPAGPAAEPTPLAPSEPVSPANPTPRRPATATSPAPAADLERELAGIRAAGEAVRARDGARARALAEDYLRAHPAGAFAPEAQVLRAEAMCLQGQVDAARAEASRLATALASSPLAARARAICPRE